MKIGIIIIGIVLTVLGLVMLMIGFHDLQLLGDPYPKTAYWIGIYNTIVEYSIVAIIGLVFSLIGVTCSVYGALSSVKVKQ